MAPLPIIDTTTEALRDITTGLVPLWRAAERPLLLGAIASLIAIALWSEPASIWFAAVLTEQMQAPDADIIAPEVWAVITDPERLRPSVCVMMTVVTGLLTSVLFCPAWYRHLLALPDSGGVPVSYIGWRLLYLTGSFILHPLLQTILIAAFGGLGLLLSYIMLPLLIAFLLRGCMVFPAICAGRPLSLRQSLRLTAGAGFPLLAVQMLLTVAASGMLMVLMLLMWLIGSMLIWETSAIVLMVVGLLLLIVISDALAVAGFAAAYRRLIRTAPPGVVADREA